MTGPSTTADPAGARAHARSMAGTRVEAMPTIPASAATDLPPGVAPDSVVWDETIAAGGYAARILTRWLATCHSIRRARKLKMRGGTLITQSDELRCGVC